jgi:hypothetical protein
MVEPDFGDPVILLDAVTVRDLPTPASAVGVRWLSISPIAPSSRSPALTGSRGSGATAR